MTSFMHSATVRNHILGAGDSQAHDSAVAEVGLMLAASARTAAGRVGDAWSEQQVLAKARRQTRDSCGPRPAARC
jgi:hypothetical protein